MPDPLRSADAFPGMDGGVNRACRGANESDNSDQNWIFYPISQAPEPMDFDIARLADCGTCLSPWLVNDLHRLAILEPQVRTLEACQLRCIFKPGCVGVEFNLWGCEVWMRPGGIQASV